MAYTSPPLPTTAMPRDAHQQWRSVGGSANADGSSANANGYAYDGVSQFASATASGNASASLTNNGSIGLTAIASAEGDTANAYASATNVVVQEANATGTGNASVSLVNAAGGTGTAAFSGVLSAQVDATAHGVPLRMQLRLHQSCSTKARMRPAALPARHRQPGHDCRGIGRTSG